MSENKTGKYMKYALGEILLVMIGILLALQVNNWNEVRKMRVDSITFLQRLSHEIQQNVTATIEEIRVETAQAESSNALLNMFLEEVTPGSSRKIDSLIFIIMNSNSINVKQGTLTEGLNTGKVALIASDSLKSKLYSLTSFIEDIKYMERIESNDILDNLTPFLYKNFNYRTMDRGFADHKEQLQRSKFDSQQNLELLNSMEFESIIDNRFYNNNNSLKRYKSLLAEFESINELINKSLKSYD